MLRFLLIALTAAAALSAQDAPYTLQVDVAMVSVDVAVFDGSGKPVEGLKKEDFAVYEDGRRQEVRSFASSDTPYNVLLVIDRSGSMADMFPLLLKAVNRFIVNLRVQDRFELAAFNRSVKRLVEWRSPRNGNRQTIQLETGGNTDFYKALEWASGELRKIRGRKAALFYTDGEDYRMNEPSDDEKAFRKAVQNVRRANAPFHFVGLATNPSRGGGRLKALAEATGGQAHFPEAIEEVLPLYDRISRELGMSYTLGYLSDRPDRDGTFRRVQVSIRGGPFRISQSRAGYTAN
jgi:VWFA-related protein